MEATMTTKVDPSTPVFPAAEREARAWLEALNAGDAAALKRFLDETFPSHPPELTAKELLAFGEMTGGFDIREVEQSTPERFSALVEERASRS